MIVNSTEYYRKNPTARRKKKAYDTKLNAQPEQRAKRAELNRENRKRGRYGKANGKDLSHTKNGLVYKSSSANRGSRSDSSGDRNARGRSL